MLCALSGILRTARFREKRDRRDRERGAGSEQERIWEVG